MELSSDKVRQQYLHYIELFKELYPLKIKNITAVKAQQVINSTGESYDVRKKAKTVLSSIMSFAVRQGWIQSHPVGKCTLPEYIKNDKEIFTADEEDRLWDYYHGNLKLEKEKHRNGKYISADMYKMCAAFTLILIHTAARPGEIYGVDPKNVDLSKNRILKSGIKTKKGKERSIIITPIIRPLIKEYLLEENKFQAVSDATIRLDCEKLYKKLGFKNHHVPSAGRTTGATRMVMSGATHENLKTVMGHTDIRTTDKYYIIADEKNAEAALIHSENVYMEHGDEDIESVDREIKRLQNKKADLMRKQAVKRDKTKMDVDIESHRDGSSTFTIKPGRDSVFHNESHDI